MPAKKSPKIRNKITSPLVLDNDHSLRLEYIMTTSYDRNGRLFKFSQKYGKADINSKEFKDIAEAMNDNYDTDVQLLDRETDRLKSEGFEHDGYVYWSENTELKQL